MSNLNENDIVIEEKPLTHQTVSSIKTPSDQYGVWIQYLKDFPFYGYSCNCHACKWVRENWKHS